MKDNYCKNKVKLINPKGNFNRELPPSNLMWHGDVELFLDSLPESPIFDLVFTSPPYNIGKPYEEKKKLEDYLAWQKRIIEKIAVRLKSTGSICWQVGNFIEKRKGGKSSTLLPLDIVFHKVFQDLQLQLRNRVIWHFGHGLHCAYRFSGRYEVVLWYTKSDEYIFNLDNVRIEPKYPGKKHFKGPNVGKYSCNPKGKNPEDIWNITDNVLDIPNVKSKHVEKTVHPCQFPVALVERFVLALTNPGGLVFDPFAGVSSSGVAALINGRRFWGCEIEKEYIEISFDRLGSAMNGTAKYRPFNKSIYDHTKSKLSKKPT